MTQQVEYTYKLIKGGDGNLYVSVEPLMKDIVRSIEILHEMDINSLNDEERQIFDLKILGLTTIYQFLGGFITEQTLKEKSQEYKGQIELNAGTITNVH